MTSNVVTFHHGTAMEPCNIPIIHWNKTYGFIALSIWYFSIRTFPATASQDPELLQSITKLWKPVSITCGTKTTGMLVHFLCTTSYLPTRTS